MTEQLNQVYAYLLKIEEASRKDVTGIQFAFEAGGYAKAAMAICESALNWPKHSNVEAQAKPKTGFDFGATRVPPPNGTTVYSPVWGRQIIKDRETAGWIAKVWDRPYDHDDLHGRDWLDNGTIFLYPTDCQAYCDYLNSLYNEE